MLLEVVLHKEHVVGAKGCARDGQTRVVLLHQVFRQLLDLALTQRVVVGKVVEITVGEDDDHVGHGEGADQDGKIAAVELGMALER